MPFQLYLEDIVISGIAAKFPDSENMDVFKEKLLNGEDMVTSERPRWKPGFLGLPVRNGRIPSLDKFDAQYFGVNTKQAHSMDPQMRMLLELTHETMIDAGVNPQEMRGTKTGVFIGISSSDSETYLSAHPDLINGYVSPGHHRSMIANRISFTFDLKGPSFPVDTACSSSMIALETAVNAIRLGKCDSAIVGGSNLVLHPYISFHSHKLGMFSPDGKCKSFDASGNGYVRSEGIAVVFLQKKKVARREYLTIVNIRSNTDGYKPNGITFPSGKVQKMLLQETYAEVDVDPSNIEYFEAHGTGTKAGDPQELNAVTEFFCTENRNGQPLLIGSVKSNVGHLEPVAGLASVAKMIVASQTGLIPTNLHYNNPNVEISGLTDGRLKVVTENTKWRKGLFGINSFGWGGANVHGIFRPGRETIAAVNVSDIPTFLPFSGRTKESVEFAYEKLSLLPGNKYNIAALAQQIHKCGVAGHPFRGYALLSEDSLTIPKIQEVKIGKNPQIWYVFSGMGSQHTTSPLLQIKPFRESIEKSSTILRKFGYDLNKNMNATELATVTDSFINIVTAQVALVDTLSSLGIKPDGIIGHSVGEVSCGYADGCLSHEEAITLAYFRGVSLQDIKEDCIVGSMAAIGRNWEEIKTKCPPDVFPACFNTKDSVTLSGPVNSIKQLVKDLTESGIFAREVQTNGFAFHSKYVLPAGERLKVLLENINLPMTTNPKPRSKKWISTSVLENDTLELQNCGIDYHINNLVSPVQFAEALDAIPEDGVVIEIAPHALLQALLRRGLPSTVTRIPMCRKDAENPVSHLVEAIGSLYLCGLDVNFSGLYEPVQFPVSVDTPMLSPLVKWDHGTSWTVGSFSKPHRVTGESIVDVSLGSDDYAFLADHVIDGRAICPVTMYMFSVWRSFAHLNETSPDNFPVVFESVEFHRPILLSKENNLRMCIQILNNSGRFEIEESNMLLASGIIRKLGESELPQFPAHLLENSAELEMSQADVYKELKLRGYEYKPRFQGIQSSALEGNQARVRWTNHWVSFFDSILQTMILPIRNRDLDLPASISKLAVDPMLLQSIFEKHPEMKLNGIPVINTSSPVSTALCPGLLIEGMGTKRASRKPLSQSPPMFNDAVFIPYFNDKQIEPINGLTALMDIVLDNSSKVTVEYAEFLNFPQVPFVNLLTEIDAFRTDFLVKKTIYCDKDVDNEEWSKFRGAEFVSVVDSSPCSRESVESVASQRQFDVVVLHDDELVSAAINLVSPNGFLILAKKHDVEYEIPESLKLVSKQDFTNGESCYLYRKLSSSPINDDIVISIQSSTWDWFDPLQDAMRKAATNPSMRIFLTAQPDKIDNGIVGLVKSLRKEPGGTAVRYLYSMDVPFDIEHLSPELERIRSLNLTHSVINAEGVHGFFLHRQLSPVESIPAVKYFLDMVTEGDPQSFNWIRANPFQTNTSNRAVNVHFASLNLAELTEASHEILNGTLHSANGNFAIEYSGVDSSGVRLVGITDTSTVSSQIYVQDKDFVAQLPHDMTLEAGATLPLSYFSAIYAIIVKGNFKTSENILVTNSLTPLGQAAVNLSLGIGGNVTAVVKNDNERDIFNKLFPTIPLEKVISQTEIDGSSKLRTADVILNTISAEELKKVGVRLNCGGRLIDVNNLTEIPFETKGISILRLNPTELLDRNNSARSQVAEIFRNLLNAGKLKPIEWITYTKENVQEALRGNSTPDTMRKVLVRLREENDNELGNFVKAISRTYFDASKAYILIGGLGETGVEIVSWMVSRGARKFILCNRSGATTSYQKYHIQNWERTGATVLCPKIDATIYSDIENVFKLAKDELGPIGGIFNLSMVLRDGFIESLSRKDFEVVVKPKVFGTLNLDKASRIFCGNELEYFVAFSSITAARGNAGQTNYGFGNSMTERLIERRLTEGLPGMAIQFGPIGDVGYVEYEMGGNSENKVIVGTHPQRIRSVLSALDKLLLNPTGIKTSVVIAKRQTSGSKLGKMSLLESLAQILGIQDTKAMDLTYNLGQLGMDSLMTVEIKQMMEQAYGIFISIQDLRSSSLSGILGLEKCNK